MFSILQGHKILRNETKTFFDHLLDLMDLTQFEFFEI
jgi:hypothetical protein